MPGTRKAYWVKAFLFHPDNAESHWQEWDFDVQGLDTLPDTLASHVAPFVRGLADFVLPMWKTNRLRMLRNSLSYHAGAQGVTGFPITAADGTAYKLRVFAGCRSAPPTFSFTATLHYQDDPGETLETWTVHPSADLYASLGWLQVVVGQKLLKFPDWPLRSLVARLRQAIRNGTNSLDVGCDGRVGLATSYVVHIKAIRHDGN